MLDLFQRKQFFEGHIISQARALSFNGLANAIKIIAINNRVDCNPAYPGDIISAWSEVLATYSFPNKTDVGALRLRTVAQKNQGHTGFPYKNDDGTYDINTVLDFDYWVLMPRST